MVLHVDFKLWLIYNLPFYDHAGVFREVADERVVEVLVVKQIVYQDGVHKWALVKTMAGEEVWNGVKVQVRGKKSGVGG